MAYGSYEEALIAEQYPGWLAYFHISPEITLYLTAAAQQQWSNEKLLSVIYGSDWWKTTPSPAREAINLQVIDPASYQQQLGNKADLLRMQLTAAGVVAQPQMLSWYSHTGLMNGLSDEQIFERYVMDQSPTHFDQRGVSGQLGEMTAQIQGKARNDWGWAMDSQNAYDIAKTVVAGRVDESWVNDHLRDIMLNRYAYNESVTNAIHSGQTLRQFVSPYLDLAAKELEINPGDVDLTDAKWRVAWDSPSEQGTAPMNIADWQTRIRTDQSYGWDVTTNAKTQAAEMGAKLLETFGANA